MIYDCFIFFNELDLLELRLNELDYIVDKFVIVEATKTFTNKPKPLVFQDNKEKFSKFLDKIDYLIVDDFPEYKDDPWEYEYYQRNSIKKALNNCSPDDIIMISDIDEIPNPETVLKVKDLPGIKCLEQKHYYFYVNYINKNQVSWPKGTRIVSYKDLTLPVNEYRYLTDIQVDNGGWHFSYLGGVDKVKLKIDSYSHQEFNNEYFNNTEKILSALEDGVELFNIECVYQATDIDDSYPKYLLNNLDKFKHLMRNKSVFTVEDKLKLALDLQEMQKFEEAKNIYFEILEKYPYNHKAMHQLGLFANKICAPDVAIEYIEKAIELKPLKEYYKDLIHILLENNANDTAKEYYQKLLELDPDDIEIQNEFKEKINLTLKQ